MSTFIVWLDASVDLPVSSFRGKLSEYKWVQFFSKSNDCIDYIKTHLVQTIFLIVSGSFAENVVSQVNEYNNVKQIFVFCASIASHTHWAINYTDRLFMFDHEDDLLERLWREVEEHFRNLAQQCLQQAEEAKTRANQYKQPSCG